MRQTFGLLLVVLALLLGCARADRAAGSGRDGGGREGEPDGESAADEDGGTGGGEAAVDGEAAEGGIDVGRGDDVGEGEGECQPGAGEACLCADGLVALRRCTEDRRWSVCGCPGEEVPDGGTGVVPDGEAAEGGIDVGRSDDVGEGEGEGDGEADGGADAVADGETAEGGIDVGRGDDVGEGGGEGEGEGECQPGERQLCDCPDGRTMERICVENRWSDCPCQGDCLPGEQRLCAPEPEEPPVCEPGVQTCHVDGRWSGCVGRVVQGPEVCDGLDNDCDGVVDQGLVEGSYACAVEGRDERLCCRIDLGAGRHDCPLGAGQPIPELLISQAGSGFNARVTVDLHGWRELELLVHAESPTGSFQLNLGDSSTNNGHGGDSGTQSYDAEFQWTNQGQDFALFPGDVGTQRGEASQSFAGLLPPSPPVVDLRLVLHNGYLRFSFAGPAGPVLHTLTSPSIFQIDEAQGEVEGQPNSIVYLGLGRVVSQPPGNRIGEGIRWAELTFHRHPDHCRRGERFCGPQDDGACHLPDRPEAAGDDLDNDCDGQVDEAADRPEDPEPEEGERPAEP